MTHVINIAMKFPSNPFKIIIVDPLPVYAPARPHKRKRIAKKWLKRYGYKVVRWNYYLGDNSITIGFNFYCHAHTAQKLREQMQIN